MTDDNSVPQGPPQPDPALKSLEFFVGTWTLNGRTLDSETDNVSGTTTFEWLPGGFFLQQRIELDFAGYTIHGLELIGYDPSTGKFPSTVFASMAPTPIPYEYDIQGRDVTITTELSGGATFTGRLSEDGNTFSGGWRPNPGVDNPGNIAYDIAGTRVT
jgi:hypothetical protein